MRRYPLSCLILIFCALPAAAQTKPITPTEPIRLFNGKDLTGFTTWLRKEGHKDPKGVFTVRDKVIHMSGEGFGYLATEKEYENYHLVAEYRWGKRTDGGKYVRNSGILLHATGPDGGAGGTWMASIECQLAQGCVGDLIPIRGKDDKGELIPVSFDSEIALGPDKRPRWKKGGEKRTFTNRQLWWNLHDPDFKELLDTHGKNDVESKLGDWTKVECICWGDRIEVLVNGIKVNACFHCVPRAGKILFQCEGFEISFRNVELRPLPKP